MKNTAIKLSTVFNNLFLCVQEMWAKQGFVLLWGKLHLIRFICIILESQEHQWWFSKGRDCLQWLPRLLKLGQMNQPTKSLNQDWIWEQRNTAAPTQVKAPAAYYPDLNMSCQQDSREMIRETTTVQSNLYTLA